MSQYGFGSGTLWGVTNTGSNPTPGRFGALQDASVDFTATTKELYGSYQFPLAVGRGTIKVQGKARYAQMQSRQLGDLFFGVSASTGQNVAADGEAGNIPSSVAYTVTVVNSATWTTDLGVRYATTGLPFTRVASAPTVGQYSVSAGVYTFAVADAGLAVKIDYMYTVAASGSELSIANQLIGTTPTHKAVLQQQFNGNKVCMQLNQCVSSKYTFATKLEDFNIPEWDFSAFVDTSNTLGILSFAEAS